MTLEPNTDIPQPEAQKHKVSITNHIPDNSTKILPVNATLITSVKVNTKH